MAGTYLLAMIILFLYKFKTASKYYTTDTICSHLKDAKKNLVSHEKNKSIILDKTVLFTSFAPDFLEGPRKSRGLTAQ